MKKHPLLAFFILAYVVAWVFWLPALLSDYGLGILHINPFITIPLLLIGILLGPGIAGWYLSGILEGNAGRKRSWHRFIEWRIQSFWYAFALLLPLLANLVADLIAIAVEAPILLSLVLATIPMNLSSLANYLILVPGQIIGSPIGEEPGWRGFALPRLQLRFGPLRGAILLGLLWGLWHLPLIVFSDETRGASPVLPYLILFVVTMTAFSVLLALLFNVTKGSLIPVILAHAAYNTASTSASRLLFTESTSGSGMFPPALHFFAWFSAVFVLFAVVAAILTKGGLGYSQKEYYALVKEQSSPAGA